MNRTIWLIAAGAAALVVVSAQVVNVGPVVGGQNDKPVLALPEFRGTDTAQALMGAFNSTLQGDLAGSGLLKIAPRTMYPSFIPQQPSDFSQASPAPDAPRSRKGDEMSRAASGGGRWVTDWSAPPVNANYLAFGYTAVQAGTLQLRGWLYDLSKGTTANAQMIGKVYAGTADDAGARQVAHEFAADILAMFGAQSLFGTHIYFVSDRTGRKEIWGMDPDGRNQHQITRFGDTSTEPAVSPDGTKIAFLSYARKTPGIFLFSVDPPRDLRFYNQRASVNGTPSFTPDGKQVIYASSAPNDNNAAGSFSRIWMVRVPAHHLVHIHRRGAQGQPQDRQHGGLRLRALRPAAGLPDEYRWHRNRTADAGERARPAIPRGIPMGSTSPSPGPAASRLETGTSSSWMWPRTRSIS